MSLEHLSPIEVPRNSSLSRYSSANGSSQALSPEESLSKSYASKKRSLTEVALVDEDTPPRAQKYSRQTYSSSQRLVTGTKPSQPPYTTGRDNAPKAKVPLKRRPSIPSIEPDEEVESDDSSPIKRGSKVAGLLLKKINHQEVKQTVVTNANNKSLPPQADVTIMPLAHRLAPPADYNTPERWTEPAPILPPSNRPNWGSPPKDTDTTSPLKEKTESKHTGVVHHLPIMEIEEIDHLRREYDDLANMLYEQIDSDAERIVALEKEISDKKRELIHVRQDLGLAKINVKQTTEELDRARVTSTSYFERASKAERELILAEEQLLTRGDHMKNLEHELSTIRDRLSRADAQEKLLEQTQEQLSELEEQYRDLTKQEASYKDEIDEVHTQLDSKRKLIHQRENELNEVHQRLLDIEAELADLRDRNIQLERDNDQARLVMTQVPQLEEEMGKLEHQISATSAENARLVAELKDQEDFHQQHVAKLAAELESEKRALRSATAQLANANDKFKLEIQNAYAMEKSLHKKLTEADAAASTAEAKLENLNNENTALVHRLSQLEEAKAQEMATIHSRYAHEHATLKEKHEKEIQIQAMRHAHNQEKYDDTVRVLKEEADQVRAEVDHAWQLKWEQQLLDLESRMTAEHEKRLLEVEEYLHSQYGIKHADKVRLIKDLHQTAMATIQQKLKQAELRATKANDDLRNFLALAERLN